jgi:uncharacterized protein YbbC (DUF1343 family)
MRRVRLSWPGEPRRSAAARRKPMPDEVVRTGAEVFLEDIPDFVRGKNIGFVTNHTGVSRDLEPLVNVFLRRGLKVKALFGPEHGIRGEVADGVGVQSGVDAETGIPVFSLYGKTRKPDAEMLKGLDALVFDIQDVGARFYTFLWTMAHCLEAAAEHGLPFVVLDRPNPITGLHPEGPVLDPEFSSFVGLYPVPTRTAMTMGEVARFVASHLEQGFAALRVVPMQGWKRSMWYDRTGLPWVAPSPNMPTLDTATVYPGFCIFEGTNVSEGRGTTKPFEVIGAPWIRASELAEAANALGLPGVRFRATHFIPYSSKYRDEPCQAVQAHVMDRDSFRPVRAGLELLILIRRLYPSSFKFREPSGGQKAFFDLLTGTGRVRKMVLDGACAAEIEATWQEGLSEFDRKRRELLLYS